MQKKHCFLVAILIIASHLKSENPETFVQDGLCINELKAEEYIQIIKPFLPENPNILEAGCHGGEDTVILAQSWPLGHVFGFEPVDKFVGFAKSHLYNSRVSNASIWPFALAEKSGSKPFYYSTAIGAASSLLQSNASMKAICDYQDISMSVNCVNLDEWAYDHNVSHIDFMWLDMEGYEYRVLKSAPKMLKTVRVIITEVNFREFRLGMTQFKDLKKLLNNKGFTLFKIWGSPTWQGTALFIRTSLLSKK